MDCTRSIDLDGISRQLRGLLGPRTFSHSLAVMGTARTHARAFGADPLLAEAVGLLHDCAKDLGPDRFVPLAREAGFELFDEERESPQLLHQRIGALWARERFGLRNPQALRALERHTTADSLMSPLAKCLFVSDYISEDRIYEGVDRLRAALERSAEHAFLTVLEFKVGDLRRRGLALHPWTRAAVGTWLPGRAPDLRTVRL